MLSYGCMADELGSGGAAAAAFHTLVWLETLRRMKSRSVRTSSMFRADVQIRPDMWLSAFVTTFVGSISGFIRS